MALEHEATIKMAGSFDDITQVIHASRCNDAAGVEGWLASGGNPNHLDSQGWTPLLAACARCHADVVRVLLAATTPADADLPFLPSGALPIHFAGQAGSIAVAELLIAARPDHLESVWLLNGHTLLLQAVSTATSGSPGGL